MPPPTSSGRATSSRKPLPSGPRIPSRSPLPSAPRARVPGPIGSIRNASSPGGARHRLIGRGSRRPGASSMKNCPGTPGSSPPRSTRSSVYGPTGSAAETLSSSRLSIDPFLQRDRDLLTRVRDRLDRGGGAGERRDARDAGDERGLADPVPVRAGARALRGIDDEVAASAPEQVDDGRARSLFGHLAHVFDREPGGGQDPCRSGRREQAEAERCERLGHGNDRGLVLVTDGEERRPTGGQAATRGALGLGEGARK